MCGVICVNKPEGFTSFDVIAKMRGILKIKRLGHAGTLDPMATGVLPVFVGRATKACDIMPDSTKSYLAGFRMGNASDTQDISGQILSSSDMPVRFDDLEAVLPCFRGEIMQIPPMYSAVSVNGKRLYDLARQGVEVERTPREIEISSLEIFEYDEEKREGILEIDCSSGTYVRTIIHDIGQKLGCGGIMTSLIRTSACGFSLNDCVAIEDLQREAEGERNFEQFLRPVEEVFSHLPKLMLHGAQERMYRNGIKLDLNKIRTDITAERISVYGEKGFIGTAVPDRENGVLRVDKTFYL
ncbi:MAG: tRNA pseudouridine(55) synthase TruB [Oscillospiraceae bacterium]|nr:tRNA pseudouridine(55) synthase TruB [Oscillospiraceae bacterium]